MSTQADKADRNVEPQRRPSYHVVPHVHRDSLPQRRIEIERLKASSTWTDKIGA